MVQFSVSVVIPTHKRPELMQRALQSVLDQDYSGFVEVLVVFDACVPFDPPVEVPPSRAVRTLTNNRTRGLAGARNTGIVAATHELVAFLDDDDAWLTSKLTRQVAAMLAEPDAVLVGTAMEVDAGERRHTRLVPHNPVTFDHLIQNRLAGLHSSSFLFRTDDLRHKVGMVDEEVPGSYGEDYDLLLRTARLAPILVVNEPLTVVTWQGQSYFFGKWLLYGQALEWLLNKHPEFAASPKALARIEGQIAFAYAAGGQRKQGRTWALKSLKHHKRQPKAMLALGIGVGVLPATTVISVVQRLGKGI